MENIYVIQLKQDAKDGFTSCDKEGCMWGSMRLHGASNYAKARNSQEKLHLLPQA